MNTIFPFNMLKKRTKFEKHALYLQNVFFFFLSFDHFKCQNSLFVEWKGTFFYQSENIALKGKNHNILKYTAKLEYNELGYNEFTAINICIYLYIYIYACPGKFLI